jgi:hypothetical protein
MDTVTMNLRIVGGGSFPARIGTFSATWPLVTLTISNSGVSVDLRSRLLKRMLGWFVRREPSSVWWVADWVDLASVDFGRRSVVLRTTEQRGCRFMTLTRRRILPLVEESERRGIVVTQVKTTIGWFLKPT